MRIPFLTAALLCLAVTAAAATNGTAAGAVRMLVPGFAVEELPVRLPNINGLRFAPDGSLTALGYDGRIWRLTDTNRDGMPETAAAWWDRSPLLVPVGMCWSERGLYVSSSGKISLLRDTDGDGRADTEEIAASGWAAKDAASGNVDATGVTLGPDGRLYFALLVADYANPYRLRRVKDLGPEERRFAAARGPIPSDPEAEVSLYDPASERGTIQRIDPATGLREIIATGLRVVYQLAFNAAGDLFCTDQEGETWCPDGNPLDELNHIVPGRNYGFPPQHPRWLPGLRSEPPVVAFGPQHQSACGFAFDEPAARSSVSPGRGLFGPDWWRGDAIVAGESRGKLWRVRLTRTPAGYAGGAAVIARFPMLVTDVAVSPSGDLFVSCHSGLPDWGTGPAGEGRLFRIRLVDRAAPQPVAAWTAASNEIRVEFDRPVAPAITNAFALADPAFVEGGDFVSAGDRFEVLKPPYRAVQIQEAAPRRRIRVLAARLAADARTLVLTTEPDERPGPRVVANLPVAAPGGTTYRIDMDLLAAGARVAMAAPDGLSPSRLPGVGKFAERRALSRRASPGYAFPFDDVVPTPSLETARALEEPSRHMAAISDALRRPGRSWYRTWFRARRDLGALVVRSDGELRIAVGDGGIARYKAMPGKGSAVQVVDLTMFPSNWVSVSISSEGAWHGTPIRVTATNGLVGREFPPPLDSVIPEWVRPEQGTTTTAATTERFVAGDYESGRELFHGAKMRCVACHRLRGEGGGVGPELDNLASRDPASVLRDIREPDAAIHPDYVAYELESVSGETHQGFLRRRDDNVVIVAPSGQETVFAPEAVRTLRTLGTSLMPAGLLDGLGEAQVRDLLTYLTAAPPARADHDPAIPPTAAGDLGNDGPLRVLLVATAQDHGPGQHDYRRWRTNWAALLGGIRTAAGPAARVDTADGWPTEAQFREADVAVFYFWNHDWSPARYAMLDAFQARGGGAVFIHSAVIADSAPEELARRIGMSAQPARVLYRHMPFDLALSATHPLARGFAASIPFLDEPYWPLVGDPAAVEVVGSAEVDGAARPLAWTFRRGEGRVFASILGHYTWTLDDPLWRALVLRGIAWAGRRDADALRPPR